MALQSELKKIYNKYQQPLFVCALAITRCREQASDALHEAFRRLLELDRTPKDLKLYTFRCVKNAAIDQVRRRNHTTPLVEDFIFDPAPGPREAAASDEFQRRVARALLELPEDERETVVQHLYADLTLREIAELRGDSVNTVKSWYRRGLERLRAQLEEK